jgi:hypothetical protein
VADVLEQDLLSNHRVISCRRLRQRISIRESCHVFSWCFCQLETIDKDTFTSRSMEYINLICLVELKGTHRYKNCPVLQRIMPKMRNEGLSEADRKTLNSKVIDGNNVNMPRPENTRFTTFYNAKRCGINIDVFRSYLEKHHTECTPDNISKSAIVIRCLSFEHESILREVFGSRLRAVEANILIRFYAI